MGVGTEAESYYDLWNSPDYLLVREAEVGKHLGKIGIVHRNFSSILEVGSGCGGETRALQRLFPEVRILAIDRDSRAAASASQNAVEFQQLDLLEIVPRDFSRLTRERQSDLILALRTSPPVVSYLFRNTERGLVIVSLIRESDVSGYERCVRTIGKGLSLEEGRLKNEFAWVKDFG